MAKPVTLLSKQDQELLKNDIINCDGEVRRVANEWKVDFGSLMAWAKKNRIHRIKHEPTQSNGKVIELPKKGEESPKVIQPSNPPQQESQKPGRKTLPPRSNSPLDKYLSMKELWDTFFEAVHQKMKVSEIADLFQYSQSSVYGIFRREKYIRLYFKWCTDKGLEYVSIFQRQASASKTAEDRIVKKLISSMNGNIPESGKRSDAIGTSTTTENGIPLHTFKNHLAGNLETANKLIETGYGEYTMSKEGRKVTVTIKMVGEGAIHQELFGDAQIVINRVLKDVELARKNLCLIEKLKKLDSEREEIMKELGM